MDSKQHSLRLSASLSVLAFSLTLAGCGNNDDKNQLDQELAQVISDQKITALTTPAGTPAISDPLAQLGKQLFFSKALGGDMDTACASCHHPSLAGGDALTLPIGVAALEQDLLGPGRLHDASAAHHDGGPTVPRNSPTTFNLVFYTKSIFDDGRIEVNPHGANEPIDNFIRTPDVPKGSNDLNAGSSLAQAQARFPVTSNEEMRGFVFQSGNNNQAVRDALAARLRGETNELATNQWLAAFQTGLAQPEGTAEQLIQYSNVAKAIGAYENSQVFINNPWFSYLAGNKQAITDQAKRGALLFYKGSNQGGFGCAGCHSSGFFTDEGFHVVAMPQVGRGKGNGDNRDEDFGRYRETKLDDDKFAFRTPSLLNVTASGPWGHSGAFTDLTAAVKHHLQPATSINQYNPVNMQPGLQTNHWQANTEAALTQLQSLQSQGKSLLPQVTFTEQQVSDLMAFLGALTDPCLADRACLAPWIPATTDVDPDGLRLNAYDEQNRPL